jgi:hypothetical protein
MNYKEAKRRLYKKILKFSVFKLIYQEFHFAFDGDDCCLGSDLNEKTKQALFRDMHKKLGECHNFICSECPPDSICSILSNEFREMKF